MKKDIEVRDYLLTINRLVETLDRLNIPYILGGSVASSVHGIFRTTNDVDFVVKMTQEQIAPFVSDLQAEFYVDDLSIQEAIETVSSFSVLHLATMVKSDFFLLPSGEWETQRWERSQPINIGTTEEPLLARVTAAEDMILQKLVWYRLGGYVSDRQWNDILGMLKIQVQKLDAVYLGHWAKRLGLLDLLKRANDEAAINLCFDSP